jgi:prophage regulatory protein
MSIEHGPARQRKTHKTRVARPCPAQQPAQRLQRFIRLQELPAYVGLKRTQIAELIKNGEFPEPIKLSENGRAVAWLESELLAWQARRITTSRA